MKARHVTFEEVTKLLEQAVAEKGADYRYQKTSTDDSDGVALCFNFDPKTKQPSCIVGHVYSYIGITAQDLDLRDADGNGVDFMTANHQEVREFLELSHVTFDQKADNLLYEVQVWQDSGLTWGEAYVQALEDVN